MHSIKKAALIYTTVIAAAALLFGTALTVGRARAEKTRYIQAELEMIRYDLCAAADEMMSAMNEGDEAELNRAAGKVEAYLSRAALGDCGEIYREIQRICSCGNAEDCQRLVDAVKKAARGDKNALREISEEDTSISTEEEKTENLIDSQIVKRLGKDRPSIALQRAQDFACPNAAFDECNCREPLSFAYSGENVFVMVSGEAPRVVMYCFDRETDERYSISPNEAERRVELIIKKEKLALGECKTTRDGNVYRTVCYEKNGLSSTPLVTFEIYSDTGRLRLYDASDYYKYKD
ncbi:MAG: hypothetical protein IIX44_10200 [Clostridia bacterium]|nr:hypothetical protein [Clostridia bacterium]